MLNFKGKNKKIWINIYQINSFKFVHFEFSKININKLVEKIIINNTKNQKLLNPCSNVNEFTINNLKKEKFYVNFKTEKIFKESINIRNYFIKNDKINDTFLRDSLSEHFSLKTELNIKNDNLFLSKDIELYSILTTKKIYKSKQEEEIIEWISNDLTYNNIIPREYKLWFKKNHDNLEQLRAYNYQEYVNKVFEKLTEIYKNSNNNEFLQKISGNCIIDLDNSIQENTIKEVDNLAIQYYINQNENIIKGNCQSRAELLSNIINYNLENIPERFCLKFIENNEVVSYIINIASKGTIFLA